MPDVDTNVIPSSPQDQKRLGDMIQEMSLALQAIDDKRNFINDVAKAIEDEFQLKAKHSRKLAATVHKHNYAEVEAEMDLFQSLYEILIEGRKTGDAT